ncbi:hypothetical protein BJ508DRAFT_329149 [Ascobolus immersus RN42]|uniref:Uncharacterized protein n=1 Tax=Ascobolus immersus RN42 TaxID=1160509 RepID=A0A3N4HXE1_ASCIM|nr:hypothetical protein BJ508DRAFT_329149 [Ascobolus immersus RN42]
MSASSTNLLYKLPLSPKALMLHQKEFKHNHGDLFALFLYTTVLPPMIAPQFHFNRAEVHQVISQSDESSLVPFQFVSCRGLSQHDADTVKVARARQAAIRQSIAHLQTDIRAQSLITSILSKKAKPTSASSVSESHEDRIENQGEEEELMLRQAAEKGLQDDAVTSLSEELQQLGLLSEEEEASGDLHTGSALEYASSGGSQTHSRSSERSSSPALSSVSLNRSARSSLPESNSDPGVGTRHRRTESEEKHAARKLRIQKLLTDVKAAHTSVISKVKEDKSKQSPFRSDAGSSYCSSSPRPDCTKGLLLEELKKENEQLRAENKRLQAVQRANNAHHEIRDRLDGQAKEKARMLENQNEVLRKELRKLYHPEETSAERNPPARRPLGCRKSPYASVESERFPFAELAFNLPRKRRACEESRRVPNGIERYGDDKATCERRLGLLLEWAIPFSTGDITPSSLRPSAHLPNELRVLIASWITDWQDFTAYRHMDRANLQIFSSGGNAVTTRFLLHLRSKQVSIENIFVGSMNVDQLVVWFSKCARHPCFFQSLLSKADPPIRLTAMGNTLAYDFRNGPPLGSLQYPAHYPRNYWDHPEWHNCTENEPTSPYGHFQLNLFQKRNFLRILQKLTSRSTRFPTLRKRVLFRMLDDLDLHANKAFNRIIEDHKLRANSPLIIDQLEHSWNISRCLFRVSKIALDSFQDFCLRYPRHIRNLCHAAMLTFIEAMEAILKRIRGFYASSIEGQVASGLDVQGGEIHEAGATHDEGVTDGMNENAEIQQLMSRFMFVWQEGVQFFFNVALLARVAQMGPSRRQ